MTDIRLIGINKIYPPDVKAVEDVNLHIRDGEFMILLGPSGCGKSTTLRMIAGLESISSGDLFLGDQRANDVDPRDRNLAIVFQNYALYPHMTVRSNLSFGLRLRHAPAAEIERRVKEVADMLGIDGLLERKPGALSGGQRQRVALGRALVRDPVAFLFDEPLSNLDAKLRVGMRTELARIHRQLETTVFYVTHDQVEAMTLGQRIGVMKDGKLLQIADSMTLYNQPVNKFVAGFIGSPPMNFLSGRIDDETPLGFSHNSFRLDLPPALATPLAPAKGKPVVLGVRPEGITLGERGTVPARGLSPKPEFRMSVDVTEQMGNEVIVYLKAGSDTLIARVPPQNAPHPGESVTVGFVPDQLHFFDAHTELTLA